MSKNSSKVSTERHPSDGAPVTSELSPALRGGGGGGGMATAEEVLSFKLERVDTSTLGQLRPGFPIRFDHEPQGNIAATHGGKTVGYVPRRHVARIKEMMRDHYSAEVQTLSHNSVEVRVTA